MTPDIEAAPVASSVHWGCPSHRFELRSSNARVLERAAVVFRPWKPGVAAAVARQWTLDSTAPTWTVRTDVAAVEVPARPNAAIRRVEYLAVQAIVEAAEVSTMHAALVARGERGVLIAGIPETGKSTLACALWQRGFALLGDDVAIVDLAQMTAGPAPRRVSLRTSSRTLVGSALWRRIERAPSSEPTNEGWVFHPDEIAGTRPASVRVAAVVFLGRRGANPSRGLIQRVAPAHAALALLPCLNLARTLELTALLGRLTPWATAVPAYDLQRAELPAMAAAVERLLEP